MSKKLITIESTRQVAKTASLTDLMNEGLSLNEAAQNLGLPKHIRTRVEREGQSYVDELKFRYIHATPIAQGIRLATGKKFIRPIQIFIGIERIRLNWEGR